MRKDVMARKMAELAEAEGWREMIRVSRRQSFVGCGPRLYRPWGLFDYFAFDAGGFLLGIRVHQTGADGPSHEDRRVWLKQVEKRRTRLYRRFEAHLRASPWLFRHSAVLVVWEKTLIGDNGQAWWDPQVLWL